MKGRPSAYHYNTYYTDEQGSRFYNDGSEFAGLGSGSNNYAPSNPVLTQRVEADIEAFLAENPGVAREDIPADLMTASGSGLDPHISPAAAQVQLPAIAEASGLSPERLAQIVADNTEEKLLGVFGEEMCIRDSARGRPTPLRNTFPKWAARCRRTLPGALPRCPLGAARRWLSARTAGFWASFI